MTHYRLKDGVDVPNLPTFLADERFAKASDEDKGVIMQNYVGKMNSVLAEMYPDDRQKQRAEFKSFAKDAWDSLDPSLLESIGSGLASAVESIPGSIAAPFALAADVAQAYAYDLPFTNKTLDQVARDRPHMSAVESKFIGYKNTASRFLNGLVNGNSNSNAEAQVEGFLEKMEDVLADDSLSAEDKRKQIEEAEAGVLSTGFKLNLEDKGTYKGRSILREGNNPTLGLINAYFNSRNPAYLAEIKNHYLLSNEEQLNNKREEYIVKHLEDTGQYFDKWNREYADPLELLGSTVSFGAGSKVVKALKGGAGGIGKVAKEALKAGFSEGLTEFIQTYSEAPFDPKAQGQAALEGGIAGVAMAGLGGAKESISNRSKKLKEEVEALSVDDLTNQQKGRLEKLGLNSEAEAESGEFVNPDTGKTQGVLNIDTLSQIKGAMSNIVDTLIGDKVSDYLPPAYSSAFEAQPALLKEELLGRLADNVLEGKNLGYEGQAVFDEIVLEMQNTFRDKNISDKDVARFIQSNVHRTALEVAEEFSARKATVATEKTQSNTWQAYTPDNENHQVSGSYDIIEASELLSSSDEGFNPALQPRDRQRSASQIQINEISTNLNPNKLEESQTTDTGAPIINGEYNVLSGNGRVAALRQAYSQNTKESRAYREMAINKAIALGMPAEQAHKMKNPVLVRKVDNFGELSQEEFVHRSNRSAVLKMSELEQAKADAQNILTPQLVQNLVIDDKKGLLTPENGAFVSQFIEQSGDWADLTDQKGEANLNAVKRIKNALLASVIGDDQATINTLFEAPENFKNLAEGLVNAAPKIITLKDTPYDLSQDLTQAINTYIDANKKGLSLEAYMAQTDFLQAQISPEAQAIAMLLDQAKRSPKQIEKIFNDYYENASKIDTQTQGLFGNDLPSKSDVLNSTYGDNVNYDKEIKPDSAKENDIKLTKGEAEVKADYENTPVYMKAPNGEPTNLTEKQWLEVRTPSFIAKYGDWKSLAEYKFLNGDAIASIRDNEIVMQDGLVTVVMNYYKDIIGKTVFNNPILGDIEIKTRSIKSSISKGIGEKKVNAFAAIGDVLEKGIIVDYQKNWKGRGYDTALVCAPIEIKSEVDNKIKREIFILEAVVEKRKGSNKFYVHEVIQKEKLGNTFQTKSPLNNTKLPSVSQASIHNVVKKIFNVKPESVSISLDKNGEPDLNSKDNADFSKDTKPEAKADTSKDDVFDSKKQSSKGDVAMEMPELVSLYKMLLDKFPVVKAFVDDAIKGAMRRGGKGNTKIQLAPKTAELLTDKELEQIHTDALEILAETHGIEYADIAELETLVAQDKTLELELANLEKSLANTQRALVAPERESLQAREVLAHEIGHLIDYLDDYNMPQDNILAHLAKLKAYTKEVLEGLSGNKHTAEIIRQELINLSLWWRAGDVKLETLSPESQAYITKPTELYADAFSVLLNAPATLEERAPNFFNAFHDFLGARPIAMAKYKKLQMLIKSGGDTVQAKRTQERRDSLNSADAVSSPAKQKESWQSIWDILTSNLLDKWQPIYRRIKKYAKDLPLKYYDKVVDALKSYDYRTTNHEAYLKKLKTRVFNSLKKAGLTIEDLSDYMFLKHIAENRANIYNPLGYTAKSAIEALANLEKNLGKEAFAKLEAAQKAWWEIRQEMVIKPLRASGIFSEELMEILEQRAYYAPFKKQNKIVEDFDSKIEEMIARDLGVKSDTVIADIHAQIGYLGEVKNPAMSLMSKDLALMDMILRNKAVETVVDVLKKTDAGLITSAMGANGKIKRISSERVGIITLMKNGKLQAYYVPKMVSEAFQTQRNIGFWLRNFTKINNSIKMLFTQLSAGFWPVATARDIGALHYRIPTEKKLHIRNTPILGLIYDLFGVILSIPDAVRSVYSNKDVNNMLKRQLIISHGQSLGSGGAVETTILKELTDFEAETSMPTTREGYKRFLDKGLQALIKLKNLYLGAGQVFERAAKIHAIKLLDKNSTLSEAEKRNIVRMHGGSPDFLAKGKLAQRIDCAFLFYNPIVQGFKSSADAIKRDKMSLWRLGTMVTIPTAFSLACEGVLGGAALSLIASMFGYDDDELKEMTASISLYDRTNYFCIPLGWEDKAQKKVSVFRIPLTEEARILKGIFYSVARKEAALPALNFAGEQLPSVNPVITTFSNIIDYYVKGKNPTDDFSGRNIIDEDTFNIGGLDATIALAKDSWNKLGGTMIHRFKDSAMGQSEETELEKLLSSPLISSTLGRFLKVSSQGLKDEVRLSGSAYDVANAKDKKFIKDIAKRASDEGSISSEDINAIMPLFKSKAELNAFKSKVKKAALSRNDPAYRIFYGYGYSKDKKRVIVNDLYRQGKIDREFAERIYVAEKLYE